MGAQTVQGQVPGNPVVTAGSNGMSPHQWLAITQNGDAYTSTAGNTWTFTGNVFGAPTQATETTWGRVKAERR
jgi:hypothetical protein